MQRTLCKAAQDMQDICLNCKKLYFKQFKTFTENFCTLDCRSTHIYIKTEITNHINQILNEKEDDEISDFINFSNTSYASDLNKRTLKYIYIKSMNEIYNKSYNHTDIHITL